MCDSYMGQCVPCTVHSQCQAKSLTRPICDAHSGECLPKCAEHSDCLARSSTRPICDRESGICGTCTNNDDCNGQQVCLTNGKCGCLEDADCYPGPIPNCYIAHEYNSEGFTTTPEPLIIINSEGKNAF